jgi:hypothetical protein
VGEQIAFMLVAGLPGQEGAALRKTDGVVHGMSDAVRVDFDFNRLDHRCRLAPSHYETAGYYASGYEDFHDGV